MDFVKILKSLEEALYEVITWLIFYPKTLWRAVRHPLRTADYSDAELRDAEEEQYTDTLSPPLFLILTVIVSHGLELAVVGQSTLVTDQVGLSGLITDDATLVLVRAVIFSLFPLSMAVRVLRRQGRRIDRETLRRPFFAQCYLTVPSALVIGAAGLLLGHARPEAEAAGLAVIAAAAVAYLWVEARWFAARTGSGFGRGVVDAVIGWALAVAGVFAVGVVLVGGR